MKTITYYVGILVLGLGIGLGSLKAVDLYLEYTDELVTAKGDVEYWKAHTDALLSRGRWIKVKNPKTGHMFYRFAVKPLPELVKAPVKVVSE